MKNNKKTLLCAVLALTLALPTALVACNENDQNDQGGILPPDEVVTPLPEEDQTPNVPENETVTPDVQPEQTPTPEPEPEPEPTPQISYARYIRCTGNNVNIRSGAGTSYGVLGSAEKNTTYAIVGQTGAWYQTYYRGKTAYISTSYAAVLTLEKSDNQKVESVIEEGYKLIGVPYVYGAVRLHDGNGNLLQGFSAQKFDCSSLVQYMFYKGANVNLQVTTRTQVVQGKPVKKADLQRGDCLYFTNESRQHLTGVNRVGHVAVYLGNDYILHTASDYARIEKMTAARWNYYLEARRFV